MARRVLVLGTRNNKKRGELEELLSLPEFELRTLADWPSAPEVEETGTTFLENATLKAVTLARALHRCVLGEDSGLCVDALGGAPGIYSARYAGPPLDDERNNDKLLEMLADVPADERTCHYVCTAVLSDPEGRVQAQGVGRCHGRIATQRRGSGGFGYDPLFIVDGTDKTFGELPASFKQKISHRAAAIAELRPQIVKLLETGVWWED